MTHTEDQKLSLRHRLRADTRHEHALLDSAFGGLMPPGDVAPYHDFIRMNHAAHGTVEAWLADSALPAWLPDWPSWSRKPDLDADMAAMGLITLGCPSFSLPAKSLPEAIGVAYVLEGSRLGAVFIDRQFRRHDAGQLWPGATFAYLAGSGDDGHFKSLVSAMDALRLGEAEIVRCVGAARSGFDYFMAVRELTEQPVDKVTEPA